MLTSESSTVRRRVSFVLILTLNKKVKTIAPKAIPSGPCREFATETMNIDESIEVAANQ